MNNILIWTGILFCITQSAMFSGLNLAFFSLTRLRLEIETEASQNKAASKVLQMRRDSNFLLTTILWGNVGINVLLTLLSDSVLAGVISFTFSTVVITLFGEIIPQAYFSRNALKMATLLSPVLRFYQIILYPVAKPSALLLDAWLGKEAVQFFAEKIIISFIKKHMEGSDNEIDYIEGMGAINFLTLDDMLIDEEGEDINHDSIIKLKTENGQIIFPEFTASSNDAFIQSINKSGKKWIIFTDEKEQPKLVLDADGFIRSALFCGNCEKIESFCHVPDVIYDRNTNLGQIIKFFKDPEVINSDSPHSNDLVILWEKEIKRILTGADILGRLLQGI